MPEFNIEKLSFLVADSDDSMRSMLVSLLCSLGVEGCREATNGEECIAMLNNFNPDIIICEWEMEGLNGIDLVQKIRKDPTSASRMAAIIFLTAHTRMGQVKEARDAGITEYLAKPVSAESLYARICAVILKPRTFIEADEFTGPDRRRKHDPYKIGMARREVDKIEDETDVDGGGGAVDDDEIAKMLGI